MLPTRQDAVAFFDQWTLFSARVLASLDCPEQGSPFGSDKWAAQSPTAAIIHWTAAPTVASTVRWFCDPKSNVSAHAVVADRKLLWADAMMVDLPLVQALAVTAVQMRPVTAGAFHARYMNGCAYGIENQNVGKLTQRGSHLGFWQGKNFELYRSDKPSIFFNGVPYEPYTLDQVKTNVSLLRYVRAYYQDSLRPPMVVGHDNTQSILSEAKENKDDPGPHFPIHDVRYAVFLDDDATQLRLEQSVVSAKYPAAWRACSARAHLTSLASCPDEKLFQNENFSNMSDEMAIASFVKAATPARLHDKRFMAWGALDLLGYMAHPYDTPKEVAESTMVFQRMVSLVCDGIIGPRTAEQLSRRLISRFAVSQSLA